MNEQAGVLAVDSREISREQIDRLEREIAMHPGRVEELPVFHHFAPGLYAREMHIPAGMALTGKVHKTEHMNILLQGEIIVWTEGGMKHLRAPYTFVSKPGTKRVGRTVTDTIWTCFHVTDKTDLAEIEKEVIEPSDNLADLPFKAKEVLE